MITIYRDLFIAVPFDPNVRREEDIDFLINARMFGFSFFLDNQLSITHLPPPKAHPTWLQLREDIYRFIYGRAKLETQREVEGMTTIYPDDLDPYPGSFLKANLEEKFEQACTVLAEEYSAQGDEKSRVETLHNIVLANTDAVPKFDPFEKFCELQKRWRELMLFTSQVDVRSRIRDSILDL